MVNSFLVEPECRKFEVGVDFFNLHIGNRVERGSIIGRHYDTREPVKAGICGQVATVYFNPAHNSLIVMIYIDENQPS